MNDVLYQAIFRRKSVRKYSGQQLSREGIELIERMITRIETLDDSIDLRIHLEQDGKKVQSMLKGLLNRLVKVYAPHYIVVSSEERPGYLVNAGYALEKLVLELTSVGLSTCWLGGNIEDQDLQDVLELPAEQQHVILIAFGHARHEKKSFRHHISEFKRKELTEIVSGDFSDWKDILEAARLAPSAVNTQPWRFVVEGMEVHVYCQEESNFISRKFFRDFKELDIGIALAHIEIAAEHSGRKIEFVDKALPAKENMSYIISIKEN